MNMLNHIPLTDIESLVVHVQDNKVSLIRSDGKTSSKVAAVCTNLSLKISRILQFSWRSCLQVL